MEAERPIREITREFMQEVAYHKLINPKDAQTGYEYCWVYCEKHSLDVDAALFDGWEVVRGNMPEAEDKKAEDGTRRLGDTLLMRITTEGRDRIRRRKAFQDERYSGRTHDMEVIENINKLGQGKMRGFDFKDLEALRLFLGR